MITAPKYITVPVGKVVTITAKSSGEPIKYNIVGNDGRYMFVGDINSKEPDPTAPEIKIKIVGVKAGTQNLRVSSGDSTMTCQVRVVKKLDFQGMTGGVMNVPYINQGLGYWSGGRWTYTWWPSTKFAGMDRTLAQSGCGQCSIAMALSYCTGSLVSPIEFMNDSHYVYKKGSNNDCGVYVAPRYNVSAYRVKKDNWAEVDKQLRNGNPVMVDIGKTPVPGIPDGCWTKGRHFILLVGVTSNGKYAVCDPGHTDKTYKTGKKIAFTRKQIESAVVNSYTVFKKVEYK